MICPHCKKAISRQITTAQKKKVLAFHAEGFSSRDIQAKTGVSFSSVCRIVRQVEERRALLKVDP